MLNLIKSLFGGSVIRRRVMELFNAKIVRAEKQLEDGNKALEEELELKKQQLEDSIVSDLTAFIK